MAEASPWYEAETSLVTAGAAVAAGEVWQLRDGRAGYLPGAGGVASGGRAGFRASGQVVVPKAAGVVLLDGGRAFWDHSANAATFRKVGDRDFYLGRLVGDAASADTSCTVNLNVDPPYDLDLARDAYLAAAVGTQAAGGFGEPRRRGGTLSVALTATSEAQKADALSVDTFKAAGAKAVVEFAFAVPSDGSGTATDVSVGVASATHAADADSIAQHLLMHLDGNSTNISFQSKDTSTTVAATDSTADYVEGAALANRVEVWFDMRNDADVQMYVNGVNVLPATIFNVAAAASEWRLFLHAEKTSSADTYEFDLHWLRARLGQQ